MMSPDIRSHLYTWHDSLDRLRQYERGTLAEGGGSITAGIEAPNTDEQRGYDLDGVGNWRRTVFTPEGAAEPTTQVRQHNYVNQLTAMDGTAVTYDHGDNTDGRAGNGNVADDGTREYEWDALNRLNRVWRKDDPDVLVATYAYDGLGRRIRRDVPDLGGGLGGLTGTIPAGTTDFVYSGVQCVEERNPFGGIGQDEDTPVRQYVWGAYVDELIQQREIDGEQTTDYYLLSDLLYRSVALTNDGSGACLTIREAYDCDAYGRTLLFSAAGTNGWFSSDDAQAAASLCRFIFTGRSHDAETSDTPSQLYYYRARYYQTEMGRFVSRDPATAGIPMGVYSYVDSQPEAAADPLGMDKVDIAGAIKEIHGRLKGKLKKDALKRVKDTELRNKWLDEMKDDAIKLEKLIGLARSIAKNPAATGVNLACDYFVSLAEKDLKEKLADIKSKAKGRSTDHFGPSNWQDGVDRAGQRAIRVHPGMEKYIIRARQIAMQQRFERWLQQQEKSIPALSGSPRTVNLCATKEQLRKFREIMGIQEASTQPTSRAATQPSTQPATQPATQPST